MIHVWVWVRKNWEAPPRTKIFRSNFYLINHCRKISDFQNKNLKDFVRDNKTTKMSGQPRSDLDDQVGWYSQPASAHAPGRSSSITKPVGIWLEIFVNRPNGVGVFYSNQVIWTVYSCRILDFDWSDELGNQPISIRFFSVLQNIFRLCQIFFKASFWRPTNSSIWRDYLPRQSTGHCMRILQEPRGRWGRSHKGIKGNSFQSMIE